MTESVWERQFHEATDAIFELEEERAALRTLLEEALEWVEPSLSEYTPDYSYREKLAVRIKAVLGE